MKAYADSKSGGGGGYIVDLLDIIVSGVTQAFYDELVAKVMANCQIFIKYTDYNIMPCAVYYNTTGTGSSYTAKTVRLTTFATGNNEPATTPIEVSILDIKADLTWNFIDGGSVYTTTIFNALSTTEINNICK